MWLTKSQFAARSAVSLVGTMKDPSDALELLSSRVDQLEKRVYALEHASEAAAPVQEKLFGPAGLATDEIPEVEASGVFPVLGKGLLGVAGAYILRALAESSSLPRSAVAVVAVAYAMAWLVWASRPKVSARFAQLVYSGTSAVILAPMLWELTLHFKTFSPWTSAGILGIYAVLAALLFWKRDVAPVVWIGHCSAALVALSLGIATHALIPFIAVLLLLVALWEYLAMRGRRGGATRHVVVLVCDVAIWGLIFIYSGPANARADYPHLGMAALIGPGCLLWAINGGALAGEVLFLRKTISVFEAIQAVAAFALAVSGVMYFAPGAGMAVFGIVCLILASACYAALFLRIMPSEDKRNRIVFGFWSAALTLAGVAWTLPPAAAAACLGAGALVAIVIGVRREIAMLELHGLLFLVAAALISKAPEYAFEELAGSVAAKPGLMLIAAGVCSVLFYAASKERPGERWPLQILHLIPALLAAFALAALIVQGLLGLAAFAVNLGVHHVALIRTFTLCAISAAFAFGGSRWGRLEMTRIAYATLAFVAAKLLFEDLRHGRMEFIAGSIFLFALTLIVVPRLVRMGARVQR